LRINDFMALIVPERRDYVNNKVHLSQSTALQVEPVVYVGGLPHNVTLPYFIDELTVCDD